MYLEAQAAVFVIGVTAQRPFKVVDSTIELPLLVHADATEVQRLCVRAISAENGPVTGKRKWGRIERVK